MNQNRDKFSFTNIAIGDRIIPAHFHFLVIINYKILVLFTKGLSMVVICLVFNRSFIRLLELPGMFWFVSVRLSRLLFSLEKTEINLQLNLHLDQDLLYSVLRMCQLVLVTLQRMSLPIFKMWKWDWEKSSSHVINIWLDQS